jgi:hypothetical protein
MACRAYVLSELIATLDGVVSEAAGLTCDEPVEHLAQIRHTDIQLTVPVCEPHRIVIAIGVVGYRTSTRLT